MEVLNFLSQKPTKNWFDYTLNPSDLETLFDRLASEESTSESDALLNEFCDQALTETRYCCSQDAINSDPDLLQVHTLKAQHLWCLALKTASFYRWNLSRLRRSGLPLSLSHVLFSKLLEECLESDAPWSLEKFNVSELYSMQLHAQFAVITYARWILLSTVFESFPRPPPKSTVSNPALMADPGKAIWEIQLKARDEVKALVPFALKLLESICYNLPPKFATVNPKCIGIPEEGSLLVSHSWKSLTVSSSAALALQIRYDLVAEKLGKLSSSEIESNGYFDIEMKNLAGYCAALGIALNSGKIQSANFLPMETKLAQINSSESKTDLLICEKTALKTARCRVLQNTTNFSEEDLGSLQAANFLHCMLRLEGVNQNLLQFVADTRNAVSLAKVIKRYWSNCGEDERKILRVYMKAICCLCPQFYQALHGTKALDSCSSYERGRIRWDKIVLDAVKAEYYKSDVSISNPLWQIMSAYDPRQVQMHQAAVQSPKISSHIFLSSVLQQMLAKFPSSSSLDFIVLASGKAQQLAMIGLLAAAENLLDGCEAELRKMSAINPEITVTLHAESVRLQLCYWTSIETFKYIPQAQRQSILPQLGYRIKQLFAEALQAGVQLPEEVIVHCSAFLLNSSEISYLIGQNRIVSTTMDFAKLLAALVGEINSTGASVELLSREIFDLLLRTMVDNVQQKRGGGQSTAVYREQPGTLINRQRLMGILKLITEPTALSLMISFMAKLFSTLDGGTKFDKVNALYYEIWPQQYTDAVNVSEQFVDEMLAMLLHNAMLLDASNPFWLRTNADYWFAKEDFAKSLQHYVECAAVCSGFFTNPLNHRAWLMPEENKAETTYTRMIRCCSALQCHTEEALLQQMLPSPDYVAVMKCFEEKINMDAASSLFGLIWDCNLFEYLINVLDKRNHLGKLNDAMQNLSQQEINSHNDPSFRCLAEDRRRRQLWYYLAARHL